jgi:EF hand
MKRYFCATLRGAALLLVLVPVGACARPGAQADAKLGAHDATTASVTLQTFVTRHEKPLLAADADGDGRISKAEFLATAKTSRGDPTRRFAKLDANGDGILDRGEIDARLARRFKRLDADGDGLLSRAERAAGHAKRGQSPAPGPNP